jgi:DNA-binding IclR family transcriptional regulator
MSEVPNIAEHRAVMQLFEGQTQHRTLDAAEIARLAGVTPARVHGVLERLIAAKRLGCGLGQDGRIRFGLVNAFAKSVASNGGA